jgi:hypothetical protein
MRKSSGRKTNGRIYRINACATKKFYKKLLGHVDRLNLSLSTPLPYTLPNDRAQQGFML